MSQTVTDLLPFEECVKILQGIKKDEPTALEEERDAFVTKALTNLTGLELMAKADFEIKAKMAKQIDDVFYDIAALLYGLSTILSFLSPLYREWLSLFQRWRNCLEFSMTLASDLADVLRRFDQTYLAQVENIQTDTDRLKSIAAMKSFITELERNDKSAELSRRFLDLRRDVAAFAEKYMGITNLSAIAPLTKEIETLDKLIEDAQNSFGGFLSGPRFITAVGSDSGVSKAILSLRHYRSEKIDVQERLRRILKEIESLIKAGVPLESKIPNIYQMLQNLLQFAELWSSVRSQSVQFCAVLEGGLGAATNMRFKREVKLAREQAEPLRVALIQYRWELLVWIYSNIGK